MKSPYVKTKKLISVSQIQAEFTRKNGLVINPEDEHRFPKWIWPYIRRAYKSGKFTKDFTIPVGAHIDDYSLILIGVIKNAGINFPGYEIGDLPENFLGLVRKAVSAKLIDSYGKVASPEDLDNIPVPLWPYVRFNGKLGIIIMHIMRNKNQADTKAILKACYSAIRIKE